MFNQPKPKSKLDLEIDRLLSALKNHETTSDEYAKIMTQLKELTKIQKDTTPESVSADTKVMAAVNLAGIFMILRHEQINVIASKAISFVPKLR
jgi:hypothetical protein